MLTRIKIAAFLMVAALPAAASDDFNDLLVHALAVNHDCQEKVVSDEEVGMLAYLSAAETGLDIDVVATRAAAEAVILLKRFPNMCQIYKAMEGS